MNPICNPSSQPFVFSPEAIFVNPYKEGYKNITEAFRQPSEHSLSLSRRVVLFVTKFVTGLVLLIPIINSIIYVSMQILGNKRNGTPAVMTKLPEDCLQTIFSFLPPEDKRTLQSVNRKYKEEYKKESNEIVDENIKLMKQDLIEIIKTEKYCHGLRHSYEHALKNSKQVKDLKRNLARLWFDSKGNLKAVATGHEAADQKFRTYGKDVGIEVVSCYDYPVEGPVVAGEKLFSCELEINFTSEKSNAPTFIASASYADAGALYPEKCPEPIQKILDLMMARLNQHASHLAFIDDFAKLSC